MLKTLIKGNLPLLKAVFIAGAIIGGLAGGTLSMLIGLTLGILFAPKSGKELRGDIANFFLSLFGAGKPKSTDSDDPYTSTVDVR